MGKQQERDDCTDFTMDCAITLGTLGIYFSCYPALTSTDACLLKPFYAIVTPSVAVSTYIREKLLWILTKYLDWKSSYILGSLSFSIHKCVKHLKKQLDPKIFSVKNIVLKIYVFLNSLGIFGTSPSQQKNQTQNQKQKAKLPKKPTTNTYLGAIKTLLKTENKTQVWKITLLYNPETCEEL